MKIPDSIITAIFGLLGVVIGVIFTGIGGRKKRFNETVSQRRVEWIRQMSEYTGTLLAAATLLFKYKDTKDYTDCPEKNSERLFCYFKSKYHIMAQLNASEAEHQQLILLLDRLDCLAAPNKNNVTTNIAGKKKSNDEKNEFDIIKNGILATIRLIEKIEWDKTKNEAIGGKN